MSHMNRVMGIVLAGGLFATSVATADINLEFRKEAQSVCPGDTVRVSLFAVSDNLTTQPLAAIDLVLGWDPAYLDLMNLDQAGSVTLAASFFPASDPFGLNEAVPPQDGTGLYSAYAPLGTPIGATPAGVQITSFVFQAIASTPGPTFVQILPNGGSPSVDTTVWSGTQPGTPVTGTLSDARVGITFQICTGDIDDDLDVDLQDLAFLLSVFGTTDPLGDINCDGVTDLSDLTLLLSQFGQPCPP